MLPPNMTGLSLISQMRWSAFGMQLPAPSETVPSLNPEGQVFGLIAPIQTTPLLKMYSHILEETDS